MKKILLSFLSLLLLGFGQAWAGITISGTITVQGTAEQKASLSGIYLMVGNEFDFASKTVLDLSASTYTVTLNTGGVIFTLNVNDEPGFLFSDPSGYSHDWVFVNGSSQVNPLVVSASGDRVIDLVIAPVGGAGGGGEEEGTASLIGMATFEGHYSSCAEDITVTISDGADYSKQADTKTKDAYYDKLGCPSAYEFDKLFVGKEYTLTYSKEGYETQTQTVTIEEGENTAPAVTLEVKPAPCEFFGDIKYLDFTNKNVYVEGATITAYDGDGEDATVLGTAYTDAAGHWTMTLTCKSGATVYFSAEHPNIEVTGRTEASAYQKSGILVNISCTGKMPDLYGMKTYKVKQTGTVDEPHVEISWTWPQELLDDYKTSESAGIYQISRIIINRPVGTAGLTSVGILTPEDYATPPTSFTDGASSDYRLTIGSTYQYSIEIEYKTPSGKVSMPNDEALTITLTSELAEHDSVTLTLNVNDAARGTVTGAGKYEKNDMVVIKATPNSGYLFEGWREGENMISTEAETTVRLTQNRTLTAVFAVRPPILDTVTLTVNVNDATMGTVTGGGRYAKGEQVTLVATPKAGYAFKQWKAGSVVLSSKASYTFIANTDSTITAFFGRKIEYRGMVNARARQTSASSIRLDWAWPQELIDDYKKADGSGIYEISMISIMRKADGQQNADNVGNIHPSTYTLPATYYVDNSSTDRPLVVGMTYTYYMEVNYSAPDYQSVTVNNDGSAESLTVTMAADVEPIQYYTLTLTVNDDDMGSASVVGANNQYEAGDEVTVTAVAKPGYMFQCWKEGEDTVSTANPYQFTITGNRTLMAVFVAEPEAQKVTLTLNVNDAARGTVTGAGEYVEGSEVTLTAIPNEGYVFEAWKKGEETVSTSAVYKFTLNEDLTLTAVFAVKQAEETEVTITLDVNDAAMGKVTGAGKYTKNTQVTVTATANEGYVFKGWMENEQMLNAEATYRFMAQTDRSLTAVFEVKTTPVVPDSFNVTLRVNDATMGTVTGEGRYEKGQNVTIKAIANTGYVFVAWMSGADTLDKTAEYTFTVVGDTTLTAVFKADGTPEPPVANEAREQDAWNVYTEGRTLVLRGDAACRYDIYNVSGVLVKCVPAAANECRIAVDNSGMYIVRRMSSAGISVKKVMVR